MLVIISNNEFHKNPSCGNSFFPCREAGGRTKRQDEGKSRFSQLLCRSAWKRNTFSYDNGSIDRKLKSEVENMKANHSVVSKEEYDSIQVGSFPTSC